MCIVLLTTAHPSYALIIIDNRDEFILRPTSRPHWWSHPSGASVLAARDLQRKEQGTWLGITREGIFAVLTNFRENTPDAAANSTRSRGGMVTAWLGMDVKESTSDSVHHLVHEGGVKGVGGFSMVAGKLRRRKRHISSVEQPDDNSVGEMELEPVAIVSNRCDNVDDVPWVADRRNGVYGLSNTSYHDPKTWPKVENGKSMLLDAVKESVSKEESEEELVARLFAILSTDTLPKHQAMSFSDYTSELKHSIFVPAIGDEVHRKAMAAAVAQGQLSPEDEKSVQEQLRSEERPDPGPPAAFEDGMYGTQRQTVVLVDWDGNVSYRERALYDAHGRPLENGEGDVIFRFRIEGWDS